MPSKLAASPVLCYVQLMSQDLGRLLLRIAIGGLMILHGFHKMRHGIGGITDNVVAHGLPAAFGPNAAS